MQGSCPAFWAEFCDFLKCRFCVLLCGPRQLPFYSELQGLGFGALGTPNVIVMKNEMEKNMDDETEGVFCRDLSQVMSSILG